MLIFTVDARNQVGHPTKRASLIRKLIKKGRAKIVRRYGNVLLVRFVDRRFNRSETVDCEFRVGIDPGYRNIGFAVFKIYKDTISKLFSGQVDTRTHKIKENLEERSMYRNKRRYNRRKNVKRKFGKAKFRKPVFDNRAQTKFQPTHCHLILNHFHLVKKIFRMIPWWQSKIHLEYCKFDTHKLANPKVRGQGYQKGRMFGQKNAKMYVRHRDKYTCQICEKVHLRDIHVHHIKPLSQGGSDRPENMICLCEKCHKAVHTGKKSCPIPKVEDFKATGVLNSCMKVIYENLTTKFPVQDTYGYLVDDTRKQCGIEKTHANDASVIAFCDSLELQDIMSYKWIDYDISINFKQYRRHVRSFTKRYEDRKYSIPGLNNDKTVAWNRKRRTEQKDPCLVEVKRALRNAGVKVNICVKRPGKVVKRSLRKDTRFKPGDLFKYLNGYDTCKGWSSTMLRVGGENNEYVKEKLCQKILNNSGMVFLQPT